MKKILTTRYLILFVLGISLCVPHFVFAFSNEQSSSTLMKFFLTATLGITDEQMEALDELKTEKQATIKALAEEISALRMEIPEILLAEDLDTVDAEEKLEQLVALKCQILSTSANARLAGIQILTPEQRKIIRTLTGVELFEYIADYSSPSWNKIKVDPEEYIKSVAYTILSKTFGINFTDEQIEALDELRTEKQSTIKALAEEIGALRMEIPEILLAEDLDTVDAEEKLEQLVALKCQILSTSANARLAGIQILTAEQRQIIKQKIDAWKDLCPW